jgi:hypothetical protein
MIDMIFDPPKENQITALSRLLHMSLQALLILMKNILLV